MKAKAFLLLFTLVMTSCSDSLPKAEPGSGIRGEQFGIDKHINEETIDKYLNRKDTVYRDVRMLIDPANYEAIEGDSYLSGFVKGFEVVPFPYIVNVTGLPEEVGSTYQGETLFTQTDGHITPNYLESRSIIDFLFPQDKNIFLMCGGGGYAGMMKTFLVNLGYDQSKVYNVGGYWFYQGNNKVEVKRLKDNGEEVYDFYKVSYHDIDFSTLTKI